jgi:DNA repair photolyase
MSDSLFDLIQDEEQVHIRYDDNSVAKSFDFGLDELREISKSTGDPLERLDLLNSELSCSECGKKFQDRFSATYEGELLCWNCATQNESTSHEGVQQATDPAKTVLGKSGLYHKSLCDYVINVATGCTHGCKFCYVPSTPNITARQDMLSDRVSVNDGQEEWGSYLLYRDDLPERLASTLDRKQKWKQTDRGRGMVMLSSGTDCYQDRRTAQITRGCVIELVKREFPVRILTRSPVVVRDIDVFKKATELSENKDGELVRVGSSIPCLDDEQVKSIEPGAPIPSARLRALEELSENDIPIYVSMSPTYPTQTRSDFDNLLSKFADIGVDVVFHEPINPRGGNFEMTINAAREAGQDQLSKELEKISENRGYWRDYSIQQMEWAEEFGEKHGVDVHVWPDKQVINHIDGNKAEELRDQRRAISPENIATPPLPP